MAIFNKLALLAVAVALVSAAPINHGPASSVDASSASSPSPSPSPSPSSFDSLVADPVIAAASSGTFSGRGTWFTDSVGSCGTSFTTDDLIVAMNAPQQGDDGNGNAQCGKHVRIQYNGKSVTAKVVDTCPECAEGSLDLSQAAFKTLAPLGQGVIDITWSFV
ncbi:hypothetical protein CPC16_012033 [Podila verticillata]|nr:hypothetical protein CPC16_012033 [Podila verticillata]